MTKAKEALDFCDELLWLYMDKTEHGGTIRRALRILDKIESGQWTACRLHTLAQGVEQYQPVSDKEQCLDDLRAAE